MNQLDGDAYESGEDEATDQRMSQFDDDYGEIRETAYVEENNQSEADQIELPELGRAQLENKLFLLEKELEKMKSQNYTYCLENERIQRELLEKSVPTQRRKDDTSKIDRKLQKMHNDLKESEERYIEIQQLYLNDQRSHQEQLTLVQEKQSQEQSLLREELDQLREKLKSCQAENERIIGTFRQEEGFKLDVQRQIELIEEHFNNQLQDFTEIEKDLKVEVSEQREAIDELEATVRLLESELQQQTLAQTNHIAKINKEHERIVEELKEQIEDKDFDIIELEKEVKDLKLLSLQKENSFKQMTEQIQFYKEQVIPGFERNMREFERKNIQRQQELKKQMIEMETKYKVQIQQLKSASKQSPGRRAINGRLIDNYGSPDHLLMSNKGLNIVTTEQSQEDTASLYTQTPNNKIKNINGFFGNQNNALGSLRDEMGGERMTTDSRMYGYGVGENNYNSSNMFYNGARESTNDRMAFHNPETPHQMEEKKFIFRNDLASDNYNLDLKLRSSEYPRQSEQRSHPIKDDKRITDYEVRLKDFMRVSQNALSQLKYFKQHQKSQIYYEELILRQSEEIQQLRQQFSQNISYKPQQQRLSQIRRTHEHHKLPRKSMRVSALLNEPDANS